MKLLIATPAYGGMVTSRYMVSMVETTKALIEDGVSFAVYALENESFISRARNRCAMYALDHGFDKLLFIDADMIWTPEDVRRLLRSKRPIVGGTYPLKGYPIILNLNPLDGKGNEIFSLSDRQYDAYMEFGHKYADENGEVEVRHIPTGFMLIDVSVFGKLGETVPIYACHYPETNEIKKFFDFFPGGAHDGQYETEDWAFCRMAREVGFPIYLNYKVVTGHTGTNHFMLGQHIIKAQRPNLDLYQKPPETKDSPGGP